MNLLLIDWSELSLQVVITFGHFLWQACVVGLVLGLIDIVSGRARALRFRTDKMQALRAQSPDGLRPAATEVTGRLGGLRCTATTCAVPLQIVRIS